MPRLLTSILRTHSPPCPGIPTRMAEPVPRRSTQVRSLLQQSGGRTMMHIMSQGPDPRRHSVHLRVRDITAGTGGPGWPPRGLSVPLPHATPGACGPRAGSCISPELAWVFPAPLPGPCSRKGMSVSSEQPGFKSQKWDSSHSDPMSCPRGRRLELPLSLRGRCSLGALYHGGGLLAQRGSVSR